MATKVIKSLKIGIVVSKFNEFITQRLFDGCMSELNRLGVRKSDIKIYWVPGSFEIPVAALKLVKKKNIDAVICLGAVIRGETYHYELVAQQAATGVMQSSLMSGKPVVFGVLATDTVEHASNRAQENGENKGVEAAQTAVEMIRVLSEI